MTGNATTLAPVPAGLEVPADESPVVQRDVVVVGASAGGVQTLQDVVSQLPPEFPASVLVVLHLMSSGTSVLHSILDRPGPLPTTAAVDGERLERGHIYVAQPDAHLLLRGPDIHLSAGPRENGHRPAIDPLFRSAARAYGPRVIGVVLTGALDDGTDGLRLIKRRGGATVVQDPADAAYPGMPESAIANVGPDRIVPLAEIGATLFELIDAPLAPGPQNGIEDPETQPDLLCRMARRAERRGIDKAVESLDHKAAAASGHADEIGATILRLRGSESAGAAEVESLS